MSIALIRCALIGSLGLLLSCQSPPPVEVKPPQQAAPKPQQAQILPVQRWLRWQEAVATMTEVQLNTALEGSAEPLNANQSFYYGLLRQQTESYEDWVKARDIFRTLAENEQLSVGQRRLANLLERFVQSRINGYQSRAELLSDQESLESELTTTQDQNRLLELKIEAITELEATISTREEE